MSKWMVAGTLCGAFAIGRPALAADTGNAVPLQRPRALMIASEPVEPVAAEPTPAPITSAPVATAPVATAPAATAPAATAPAPIAPLPSTPEPPSPSAAAASAPTTGVGLHRSASPWLRKFSHQGFTTDLRIGTIGCLRAACSESKHAARPGFRIDGFLGGNIKGWVDIGVSGGWGMLGSNVTPGTNMLTLYGLDPYFLQTALGALAGQALGIDFGTLTVNDSKLRTAQVGPMFRVHFIPRGRFNAYVGSGVHYNLFRARYNTAVGSSQLDFHGLAVPIEAGFGVNVLEHLAVGVQFDYLWTWYAIANLQSGSTSLALPVKVLDEAAKMQSGGSFKDQLPQFWTFAFTLRARI
ncbi:MAG TPA: hypothetical protein VG755_10940 [Nannocystaceae bacterium]|nr:hypothetical protein [Nannocystaceae bacterium]